MKKIIKTIIYNPVKIEEGIYASPASFRLEMRNFMKQEMSDFYFDKNLLFEPAKNFGCFLFGQKNIWKGVVGIDYKIIDEATNKAKITVYIEEFRINSKNILQHSLETINVLLEKMIKETNFIEDVKG